MQSRAKNKFIPKPAFGGLDSISPCRLGMCSYNSVHASCISMYTGKIFNIHNFSFDLILDVIDDHSGNCNMTERLNRGLIQTYWKMDVFTDLIFWGLLVQNWENASFFSIWLESAPKRQVKTMTNLQVLMSNASLPLCFTKIKRTPCKSTNVLHVRAKWEPNMKAQHQSEECQQEIQKRELRQVSQSILCLCLKMFPQTIHICDKLSFIAQMLTTAPQKQIFTFYNLIQAQ